MTDHDYGLWLKYGHYKIRRCYSLHSCAVCNHDISLGQLYFDGGHGRRAHVECADPNNYAELETVNSKRV